MTFQPGQSGNPNGRPRNSGFKQNELKQILNDSAPQLLKKMVEMALDGDVNAIKLCMERLVPRVKPGDAPITIELPSLKKAGNSSAELMEIGAQVINERIDNNVDSSQAQALFEMLDSQRSLIETESVQKQLDDIKEKLDN